MSLNSTPSGERTHIGFFGRRNSGKSSLINAITGQSLAIVSDVKGTTTDPVYKAMELSPLGPVMLIDTPGLDDEGELGALRVKKAKQVINKTDLAVLVVDASLGLSPEDGEIIEAFRRKKIPFIIAYNKGDLKEKDEGRAAAELGKAAEGRAVAELGKAAEGRAAAELGKAAEGRAAVRSGKPVAFRSCPGREESAEPAIRVSAKTGTNIAELKELIGRLGAAAAEPERPLASDLIGGKGSIVVLVVPIDKAAPKGRLILPQQQTIRDILDAGGIAVVTRDSELEKTLDALGSGPDLVITDSQVFAQVSAMVPEDIPLTSFSILFARYKGDLAVTSKGGAALEEISNGDVVLISEGCTHHRQCEDIGTVKLPALIRKYTGKEPVFEFTSGREFPEDLSRYSLIVHCGGCMLSRREMQYRLQCAEDQGVPVTNYGMLIAYINGILERGMKPVETG